MAVFTPSGPSVKGAALTKKTPQILTLTATLAATEYALALPDGIVSLQVKSRGSAGLRLGFNVGATTGPNYVTLPPGSAYKEEGLATLSGMNLYLWSAKAGEVVEVLVWL